MSFEDYINSNTDTEEIVEVEMQRIGVVFQLKSLSAEEIIRLKKECMITKKTERTGLVKKEFDPDLYEEKFVLSSIIEPNLYDPRLQQKLGEINPYKILLKMLKAGEYNELLLVCYNINGYNKSLDEDIKEAKN